MPQTIVEQSSTFNPEVQARLKALDRAQAIVRSLVSPDCSLVDELIAERRREALRESQGE